jgi:hypothetical protein
MFDQVNQDDPTNAVSYDDWQYYADQIENVSSYTGDQIDRSDAENIARQLKSL